jgi:hypothetical protein
VVGISEGFAESPSPGKSWSSPASVPYRQEKGSKVTAAYTAARVFDGESERAIEDGAVVVEDERIASVGAATEVPPGTEVRDLGDATPCPV